MAEDRLSAYFASFRGMSWVDNVINFLSLSLTMVIFIWRVSEWPALTSGSLVWAWGPNPNFIITYVYAFYEIIL
jgi:hypothetical protein